MAHHRFGKFLIRTVAALLLTICAGIAFAQTPPAYVFNCPLLPLLLQMPENSWLQANANLYSNVWTPLSLEPLDRGYPKPASKIILPWSGFAWDSNRGDVILYGGGHANYPGNDVYRWRSCTLQWERASLPSEIYLDPVAGFLTVDGVDNSPISSHTYDNNIFLPIADRFLTWGGATYNNGHFYERVSETDPTTTRPIGPYLFDPSRANGDQVGGLSGSNVKRVLPAPIAGGHMWENRDIFLHIPAQGPLPGSHINGCAVTVTEGGHDVVYTAASTLYAKSLGLYRYQLTDIDDPYLDQNSVVGAFKVGVTGQTTCGYDPVHKLFVRTGNNTTPFQFWDLTSPGPTNYDQSVQVNASIAALQSWMTSNSINIQNCAMKYDPVRVRFVLWCNKDVLWELTPPASGNTTSGWTATKLPTPPPPAPPGDTGGTGVMGKWRYAPYYDVFVGLQDANDGDIWIYKPSGWVQPNPPGNALPTVSITSPADGADFAPDTTISLEANAADGNGIARVEYYVYGTKVGQATSPPYTVNIAPILIGSYPVVAVAVDNVGGMKVSATVTFTVSATLTTKVLRRGLGGYAGVSDTYLDATAPTSVRGAATTLLLDPANDRPLVRFAIFQSEGGPIPNGAVIQSATLALYKQSYDDTLQLNMLLKSWVEGEATWNKASASASWSAAGAAGAGTDYSTTVDALVTPSWNPGWVDFDVTARVRLWSDGIGTNDGWILRQTASNSNRKQFNSSEYTTDATLRPKLTVVYSGGTSNIPPTVNITSPLEGAVIMQGQSFALTANANDPDGTVTKVDYYADGAPIGTATTAPYSISWTPGAVGTYALTAIATDNGFATGTSSPVNVTVNPGVTGTTIVLQRGLNGYAGVSDTYTDNFLRTTVRGGLATLLLQPVNYNPLIRFAIFESEGGPVPDGSTILSATFALYKQYYSDTIRLNALLKPWIESQATWTVRQTGVPWTVGGAAGAGTDYSTATDALVSPGWNPGWVTFDVTPRVSQWAGGSANYGWRIAQTTTGGNSKTFYSSEYTTLSLRPKLTVVYY